MKNLILILTILISFATFAQKEDRYTTGILCQNTDLLNKFLIVQSSHYYGLNNRVENRIRLFVDNIGNASGEFIESSYHFNEKNNAVKYTFINKDEDKIEITLVGHKGKDLQGSKKFKANFIYTNGKGNISMATDKLRIKCNKVL